MKKRKLFKVQNTVNLILLNQPETRGNDALLFEKVVESIDAGILDHSLEWYLDHVPYLESVPRYTTVTRCRRKAMEMYPELRPARVTKQRYHLEEIFRETFHE